MNKDEAKQRIEKLKSSIYTTMCQISDIAVQNQLQVNIDGIGTVIINEAQLADIDPYGNMYSVGDWISSSELC